MIIANPIYDTVFKRMMENERVAKFFIGTILDQQIERVQVKPQEFTHIPQDSELMRLSIFRLDFIATIKTKTGEHKKILIEIQKAKNYIDLMRFRNYLGEQYKKEDVVDNEKAVLPITTIYILGFKLPEIDCACLKVERNYKDQLTHSVLEQRSPFVERLTHDSHIVQVDRISNHYQTSLDKLLSVFEQKNFVDDKGITKQFLHTPDTEDVKIMTDILHHSGTNPAERKQIETEQEAWRSVNAIYAEKEKELLGVISEKDKEIDEKDKVIDEKDKVIDEKDKVIDEKDRLIEELKRRLNLGN